jgi:hypothetical protein
VLFAITRMSRYLDMMWKPSEAGTSVTLPSHTTGEGAPQNILQTSISPGTSSSATSSVLSSPITTPSSDFHSTSSHSDPDGSGPDPKLHISARISFKPVSPPSAQLCVCRICEQSVPASQLKDHTKVCSLQTQYGVGLYRWRSIDIELREFREYLIQFVSH